jgi:hypothetical protein
MRGRDRRTMKSDGTPTAKAAFPHVSSDFTSHMLDLLQKTGPSGPTGPTSANHFISNEKGGTSHGNEVGPVDFEWSRLVAPTGPSKAATKQSLVGGGTTGTSGTTICEQGDDNTSRAARRQNGMRF